MTSHTLIIKTEADRARALQGVRVCPLGYQLTLKPATRSTPQNAKMWAMLQEVSDQLEWEGKRRPKEDWKDIFTATLRSLEVVPNSDKTKLVVLGLHTSGMPVDEMSELTELILAFGAEHGVTFKDG